MPVLRWPIDDPTTKPFFPASGASNEERPQLIRREPAAAGRIRLIFQLSADLMFGTVSVVGDFNDWQPGVTTFRGRGSVRSAIVEVEPGRRYAFRYLADGGSWFDEAEPDDYARNHQGVLNGVVDLTSAPAD